MRWPRLIYRASMNQDDLSRFTQRAGEGPVCMLNLLQFAEGGAELYAQYARAVEPMLQARGARSSYWALTTNAGTWWR